MHWTLLQFEFIHHWFSEVFQVYYDITRKERELYFFYTHSYAFESTCLTALANICRTSLNTTADSGHPCLVFHLSGSISNDSILHTTVALKLRQRHFPMLQLLFPGVFLSLHLIEWHDSFKFIYMLYNINGVVNTEPTLHSWNKADPVMLCYFLEALLNFVCYYFSLEILHEDRFEGKFF